VGKAASNKSQDSLMDHSSNYTQNDHHVPGEYLDYLDLQPDLICLFQSDFVLQFSNAAFDNFFLIDEGQPRLFFSDYFQPSQQEELKSQLESLQQGKKQISFQTLQHNKYGETRQLHWICHYLNPGLIQASARDLTPGEELQSKPRAAMPLPASEINSKSNNAGHRSQGIFNKLPFMAWALDEELNIVFWNPVAEKLIGYSREEVLNNNEIFSKLFPDPTIRDEYYKKINNCSPTVEWNARFRCKNNSDKWISCFDIGNLYNIQDWKYVLIGIDRTDEKETELALQESEQRYRSLFSSTQAGLILCHQILDAKGQPDYILIDHNRAGRIYQYLQKSLAQIVLSDWSSEGLTF
jgi:PAS domain S-box-containing protein